MAESGHQNLIPATEPQSAVNLGNTLFSGNGDSKVMIWREKPEQGYFLLQFSNATTNTSIRWEPSGQTFINGKAYQEHPLAVADYAIICICSLVFLFLIYICYIISRKQQSMPLPYSPWDSNSDASPPASSPRSGDS
jgi:hypothetical protein